MEEQNDNSRQPALELTFCPMEKTHARSILGWRYDPPYDVYDPGAGDVKETMRVFLDPEYAYTVLLTAEGELIAYCCFGVDAQVPGGDYRGEALDVGLGVRPDRTGKGQGSVYVEAILDYARRAFSPPAFRVTIAEFNARALRVWERAGFRRMQMFCRESDGHVFVILARDEAQSGDRRRRGEIRDGCL
jgi:ribosomal-protein-alanine N-acetyltransferase